MEYTEIFKWWLVLFLFGAIFFPLTSFILNNFKDKGYIFSKIIGLIFISYTIFILSSVKLLKFSSFEIIITTFVFMIINYYIAKKSNFIKIIKTSLKLIIIEELIFSVTFVFWSYVRGNLPDIHGLEKYMDFGILNSILRNNYFPPSDMWYSQFPINYYYFGHLITAVIIKISTVPSNIGYNLMLATLFGLTFASIISLVINLFNNKKLSVRSCIAAILAASFATLGGNLTTVYTFFKPFVNEHPIPFWNLAFSPLSFPNNFWYPNATRFIPFTIHEFPIYSFVVSDLHGHVLDIPIVLLALAVLFSLFLSEKIKNTYLLFVSMILAIMYMTNAWDGLIYLLLSFFVLSYFNFYNKKQAWNFSKSSFYQLVRSLVILVIGFFIFSLPFSIHFKPFVSGVGILCSPKFLTDLGKLGPLLFEANHCQKSPFWQLTILYGFFYFFVISFILFIKFKKNYTTTNSDKFIAFLIILSTILIIVPEFIYVKDIYPMHYRANTMFKLTYEAFILLSICSGYIIVKIISVLKNKKSLIIFFIPTLILIYLILSYPIFSINSFYGNFQRYKGLDGTQYLDSLHSEDYNLINWVNKNIKGNPVILEANGDSYTDFARISANTGLPTVIGWPVHEWLWRGTYDIAAPRITDVETLYTSKDLQTVKNLIKKYKIYYVVIATLEKQKYLNINEDNFKRLGKVIYQNDKAKLYKINF